MEHFDRAHSPEKRLACAIILQAVKDAQHEIVVDVYGHRSALAKLISLREIEDAKEFLTATSGEWRRSREFWCEAAGIDPDYLHRKLIDTLKIGRAEPQEDAKITS